MDNLSKTFGKLTILLLVLLAISFSALPAYAKYGGGTGEPNDPYLIYTANHMQAIGADANDWNKHFILVADINLAEYTGTQFNVIGYLEGLGNPNNKPFTGVFDGNNHTISNFIYSSTGINYIGIFGYVFGENAEIKDLGLIDPNVDTGTESGIVGSLVGSMWEGTITNCYIEGGSVEGVWRVGGLVGWNYRSTITNCYSQADVLGCGDVGGLVGYNEGTTTNCYSEGDVSGTKYSVGGLAGKNSHNYTITNCYATGSVSGAGWHVGGLVGENSGTVANCYSAGSISGKAHVGGLVGTNRNTISNCYSTGTVFGNSVVGGLLGWNYFPGRLMHSFWDIQNSGQTSSARGTGLPTAEMQQQITFTDAGWDFTTPIWTIDEGVDYPRLWWELTPVLHAEPEVALGTSNIISWDPVPGANDYYAECAADANFTKIIHNSGWITKTSCKFTGLVPGRIYWYRVKARNSAGTESQWSNVESSL